MEILVINGSPKGKGNTYKVCTIVEDYVKAKDANINFNYLNLKDCNLQQCRGCYACLLDGEDKCPLKDDRQQIEEMMIKSDGVIFLTPVYVMNVSGLYKNFTDRFAYICHRPRFHGKKAWIISSTGALGAKWVNKLASMGPASWGFDIVGSLGAITSKGISKENELKQWNKINKSAEKMAYKMIETLNNKNSQKATFLKMIEFNLQRKAFGNADKSKADYKYWKSHGWLEYDCQFFIDIKVSKIKQFLAKIISKLFV